MDAVVDLLERSDFYLPLAGAFVATLLAIVLARIAGQSSGTRPITGVLVTAVAVVAMAWTGSITGSAALLISALGALTLLSALPIPDPVAAVPGAVLLAVACSSAGAPVWTALLAALAAVSVPGRAADFDRFWQRAGLGPLVLAVVAAGVYVCVPETEQAVPLLGAAIGGALLAWPRPRIRVGAGGWHAAVGLIAWVAAIGGDARAGAVVGAVACLGFLAIEPVVRAVSPVDAGDAGAAGIVLAIDVATVFGCARVAGLRSSAAAAAAIAVVVLALGAGALLLGFRNRAPTASGPAD
jgi:hypothetical protein